MVLRIAILTRASQLLATLVRIAKASRKIACFFMYQLCCEYSGEHVRAQIRARSRETNEKHSSKASNVYFAKISLVLTSARIFRQRNRHRRHIQFETTLVVVLDFRMRADSRGTTQLRTIDRNLHISSAAFKRYIDCQLFCMRSRLGNTLARSVPPLLIIWVHENRKTHSNFNSVFHTALNLKK